MKPTVVFDDCLLSTLHGQTLMSSFHLNAEIATHICHSLGISVLVSAFQLKFVMDYLDIEIEALPQKRQPAEEKASLHFNRRPIPQKRQNAEGKANLRVLPSRSKVTVEQPQGLRGEGVILARSTTGVLMSSGYGVYETATLHVTTPRPPSTSPQSLQIITPQLHCPELRHQRVEYYTEAPNYYTTTYHGAVVVTNCILRRTTSFAIIVNNFVVLLLGVVSLMDELTTGVLSSPGYVRHQSTTPPSYYATTTYDTTSYYTKAPKYPKYYTTKESECYTTTNASPAYYTEAPKYYSAPSYYTEVPAYYTTKTVEYYTEGIIVIYGVLLLGVESFMAELTAGVPMSPGYGGYQTTTPASDCTTTTYATTSYYTEASMYYTTNVPDCYTKT
ncbi:hypothetical protein DAPPUDRAFT_302619 [Daphnia pulex]|uniref:Uncharacterized protein n=1 Tax=Daphnia pulex TaxID=6669 RepID=E9GDY5_DAPPU|nr:hypothetical protein DAPPUDRAFT_302619 [Daphnia pulex]|eukprot:EFX82402.1 hypothetical protein DAPPUDRAFT_302619 [Daphnia pulex]